MTEEYHSNAITKNSDWAVISLIAGIIGLFWLPFVGSITAIIAGSTARNDIKRSMGRLVGEGMATWGQVLGWISLTIHLVIYIALVVFMIGFWDLLWDMISQFGY